MSGQKRVPMGFWGIEFLVSGGRDFDKQKGVPARRRVFQWAIRAFLAWGWLCKEGGGPVDGK